MHLPCLVSGALAEGWYCLNNEEDHSVMCFGAFLSAEIVKRIKVCLYSVHYVTTRRLNLERIVESLNVVQVAYLFNLGINIEFFFRVNTSGFVPF